MNDDVRLVYVKSFLRRQYATNVAGLRALAQEVFDAATEEVVITSQGFQGGSASGQVQFDKTLLGLAIEELIAELDPTNAVTGLDGSAHLDFSQRCIEP